MAIRAPSLLKSRMKSADGTRPSGVARLTAPIRNVGRSAGRPADLNCGAVVRKPRSHKVRSSCSRLAIRSAKRTGSLSRREDERLTRASGGAEAKAAH